jgi:hypothetical protein
MVFDDSGGRSREATAAIVALCAPTRRVTPDRVVEAPRAAGIYAWWSSEPELLGIPGTPLADSFLYYVGITKSKRDLRKRLSAHTTGKARSSTLRLTLTSLGAVEATPLDAGRGKVRLPADAEAALTGWIAAHLQVSWVATDDPGDIEAEVIAAMLPPLNLEHNSSHPKYGRVKAARAEFRARAIPTPDR